MSKKTSILFAVVLCAYPVFASQGRPTFSWDRVPVYLHFGSHTRMTNEQIETAANLIQRLYQAYTKAHPLTQSEGRKVAQDATNKLYLLAEWAGKISFWKCFVIMMKTVELDPLSFFFRLPVISKNILVGRAALE